MAEPYHCIYCFDVLVSHFDVRPPMTLARVEQIYRIMKHEEKLDAVITLSGRILSVSGDPVPAEAPVRRVTIPKPTKAPQRPLFVTWNKETTAHKLRGCIGTFEELELEKGLQTYAITAALEDTRFNQIRPREIPELSCVVSILTDFEPAADTMDWELGVHGLRITFYVHGRRHSATYLPDVPVEQGWTKEETMISLVKKAGWLGRGSDWRKLDIHVIRYKGTRASVDWEEYSKVLQRHLSELGPGGKYEDTGDTSDE